MVFLWFLSQIEFIQNNCGMNLVILAAFFLFSLSCNLATIIDCNNFTSKGPSINSTSNLTNSTINSTQDQHDTIQLASLYTLIAGSIAFLVVFPFAVYHIPKVALDPTGAVLIGACLMVLLRVITQTDVYDILGIQLFVIFCLFNYFPRWTIILLLFYRYAYNINENYLYNKN